MNQPSEAQIVEALEKSGYLFEQDVATLLSNLDFHVETSWAYLDTDSEKSRELDVRAIKRVAHNESHKLQVFVELLVECKDFGSPLVFLERIKNERELKHSIPGEYIFPLSHYKQQLDAKSYQEVAPFIHIGLREKHYYYSEEKKATQFRR